MYPLRTASGLMMLKVRCATPSAPSKRSLYPISLYWSHPGRWSDPIWYIGDMFSSESSSIRFPLAVATVFFALIVPAPRAVGQDSSNRASGPQSPSELRVFDPSLIDKAIDPCENFYLYSCNGWFKRNPLPPDQTSYGRFTELAELNRLHLRQILESASDAQADARSANEQKIGDEYASCMDVAAINKLGIAPLQPELDRIAALKSASDLPPLLGHLHSIGVNAFFTMRAEQDLSDSTAVIQNYLAGGLGLPERDYYTRTDAKSVEQRMQYVAHVRAMFVLAGEPEAQASKDAETVLALETRLAKASLTVTERREPTESGPSHQRGRPGQGVDPLFADRVSIRGPGAGQRQGERRTAEVLCGVQRAGSRHAGRSDPDIPALVPAALIFDNQHAGKLRNGKLELLCAYVERRGAAAGSLEALHEPRRSRDGRGPGSGLCCQILPAGGQAARSQHDRDHRSRSWQKTSTGWTG